MADSKPAPKEEKAKFAPSVTNPNQPYSEGYFAGRTEYLSELEAINLETSDGFNKYKAIDPTIVDTNREYAAWSLNTMAKEESGRLNQFARKNVSSLTKLLEEKDAIGLALQTPSFRSKGSPLENPAQEEARKKAEKDYDALSESIATSRQSLQLIEGNPQQYISQIFERYKVKPDSVFAAFIFGNLRAFLEQHKGMILREVQTRVSRYGAPKYLAQNYANATKLEPVSDAEKASDEKIAKLRQDMDLAKGEDKLKVIKALEEAEKKHAETYSQQMMARQVVPKFIESISDKAYESIMMKKAREEAEKKAKENKNMQFPKPGKEAIAA